MNNGRSLEQLDGELGAIKEWVVDIQRDMVANRSVPDSAYHNVASALVVLTRLQECLKTQCKSTAN